MIMGGREITHFYLPEKKGWFFQVFFGREAEDMQYLEDHPS